MDVEQYIGPIRECDIVGTREFKAFLEKKCVSKEEYISTHLEIKNQYKSPAQVFCTSFSINKLALLTVPANTSVVV